MITARREIRPIKILPASNVICFHSNVTNTHVTASGIAYKNTVSKTLKFNKKETACHQSSIYITQNTYF
jgi:hypothetical protein